MARAAGGGCLWTMASDVVHAQLGTAAMGFPATTLMAVLAIHAFLASAASTFQRLALVSRVDHVLLATLAMERPVQTLMGAPGRHVFQESAALTSLRHRATCGAQRLGVVRVRPAIVAMEWFAMWLCHRRW